MKLRILFEIITPLKVKIKSVWHILNVIFSSFLVTIRVIFEERQDVTDYERGTKSDDFVWLWDEV